MSRTKQSMPSWVRYSVAMYVGLLLAGSLVEQKPHATADTGPGRYAPIDRLVPPPREPTLRERMQDRRQRDLPHESADNHPRTVVIRQGKSAS